MRQFQFLIGFALSLFLASGAQGNSTKVLVIAEVEDTLKIAHMQSFWDALNYVQDPDSRYLGMKEVLQLLAAAPTSASFVYSTMPLELLVGRVQSEFLFKHNFPQGQIVPHRSTDDVEIRTQSLRDVIRQQNPERVVLIGHNGGRDTEVFVRLSREFPQIQFNTYIHLVYSSIAEVEMGRALEQGQIGFVTSLELLLDLNRAGLISDLKSAVALAERLLPRILSEISVSTEKEKAIPYFVNCQNFYWHWQLTEPFLFLSPLQGYLADRCKQ